MAKRVCYTSIYSWRATGCTRVWNQDRGVLIEGFTAEEGPEPYGTGDHQRDPEGEHADADHEDTADWAEGREAVLRIEHVDRANDEGNSHADTTEQAAADPV